MIYVKDPDAVIDYAFDWATWLPAGDSINSHSVAVTVGDVTIQGSSSLDGTVQRAFVAGGTAGTEAKVRFRVGTAQGRADERTIELHIRHT